MGPNDAFAQDRAIDAGAAVVIASDFFQDDGRGRGGIGVERNHDAALIFLDDLDDDDLADLEFAADQLVLEIRAIVLPLDVKISAELAGINGDAGLLGEGPQSGEAEERDGARIGHAALGEAKAEVAGVAFLEKLAEIVAREQKFPAFGRENFDSVTRGIGDGVVHGRRVEEAGAKENHVAALARRHPGKIGVVAIVHKGEDAVADEAGEGNASVGKILASHAFYGISPERRERANEFHEFRLRVEELSQRRRAQIRRGDGPE